MLLVVSAMQDGERAAGVWRAGDMGSKIYQDQDKKIQKIIQIKYQQGTSGAFLRGVCHWGERLFFGFWFCNIGIKPPAFRAASSALLKNILL